MSHLPPHLSASHLDAWRMALALCSLLHVVLGPCSSQRPQEEARGQGRGLPLPPSAIDELMQEKEDAGTSRQWAASGHVGLRDDTYCPRDRLAVKHGFLTRTDPACSWAPHPPTSNGHTRWSAGPLCLGTRPTTPIRLGVTHTVTAFPGRPSSSTPHRRSARLLVSCLWVCCERQAEGDCPARG